MRHIEITTLEGKKLTFSEDEVNLEWHRDIEDYLHQSMTAQAIKTSPVIKAYAHGREYLVSDYKIIKESKMKFKKKYIKLGKPYIEERKIKVVIEEQSHRGDEFGNWTPVGDSGKTMFKASNGINLCSRGCPQAGEKCMFMRGVRGDLDNKPLVFDSLEVYLEFEAAVKEYNEYFSKPQVKEVTMEELHKLLGYEVKIKEGK